MCRFSILFKEEINRNWSPRRFKGSFSFSGMEACFGDGILGSIIETVESTGPEAGSLKQNQHVQFKIDLLP